MKRILYFETFDVSWIGRDIPRNLEKIGYEVCLERTPFHVISYDKEKVRDIELLLVECKPDYVFTYDFSRIIAEACFMQGINYISWVYDCPHEALYSKQAFYKTNYIFIFDKMQCNRLKEIGLENLFYMPLAVDPERVSELLKKGENSTFNTDISFIGSLYYRDNNEMVLSKLTGYGREKWEMMAGRSFMNWNKGSSIYDVMTDDFVELFDSLNGGNSNESAPYMSKKYKFESYILSRYVAYRERVKILNDLSDKYKVVFYTRDKKLDELSRNINIKNEVNYENGELSRIYKNSKICVNISLHCIETGLSQRIFDVMASGGFLLTNYQEELEDFFEIGKDLEVFHNEEELLYKVGYYIEHDRERERIIQSGRKKVEKNHTYKRRLSEIMRIVDNSK